MCSTPPAPNRQGKDGIVRGLDGEEMYAYALPGCRVEGTVDLCDGEDGPIAVDPELSSVSRH